MKLIITVQMIAAYLLLLFVFSLFAQYEIGIAWEFNENGNLQGWTASPNFSNIEVKDSMLTATVAGSFPYLSSEEFNISATNYRFIFVRMKLPGATSSKIIWNNDKGE